MRKVSIRLAGLLLPLLLASSFVNGQTVPPPPPEVEETTTLKMDVQRVVLYVTVREGKTGFVGDLSQKDFTVKDDGKAQEIRQFSRADVPVAVGLVIDNSQSMMNKKQEVIAAAKAFVRASNPEDEMFVVHFNDNITYGLPKDKMFSSDHAELEKAIDNMEPDRPDRAI